MKWSHLDCELHNGRLIGYAIVYHPIDGFEDTVVNVSVPSNELIINVEQNRVYYISVAAVNEAGVGPSSKDFEIDSS